MFLIDIVPMKSHILSNSTPSKMARVSHYVKCIEIISFVYALVGKASSTASPGAAPGGQGKRVVKKFSPHRHLVESAKRGRSGGGGSSATISSITRSTGSGPCRGSERVAQTNEEKTLPAPEICFYLQLCEKTTYCWW